MKWVAGSISCNDRNYFFINELMLYEPITAITDFMITAEVALLMGLLQRDTDGIDNQKYWMTALILLGVAALLGGVAHGFNLFGLFAGIYLCMAGIIGAICLAALSDGYGDETAQRWRNWIIGGAVIFYGMTLLYPHLLVVYTIVGGFILAPIVLIYIRLWRQHPGRGDGYLLAGIMITLTGFAGIAFRVRLDMIWQFNHNDLYHLVQMVAIVFFYLGIRLKGRSIPQRAPTYH